ncbi:MAG: AAA family ATPase, partial [Muribaculaceae bacterium]|nr:AAA family ATPase [Muribaculaceae bacterium]
KDIDLDNAEFKQIEALINYTDTSVFMTGKAGTGKSTFLKYITATTRKKHVVLAPTGIAAVNAGGQTLHSFFHLPLKPLMPDDPEFARDRLSKRMKYSKQFVKLLRDIDLIIIDEISMVRADVIDFIDKLLRHYCRNNHRPFGGKQLLMVGDVFQLEPVVTSQAREILRHAYSNFYFFSARVFAEFELVPIELRKVYRQSDSTFINLLDRIRSGNPDTDDIRTINARVNAIPAGDSADMTMTIATRREIVDNINESHLTALPDEPLTFTAEVKDDFPESSFPTDRYLTLKKGAQVVFIRNDPEGRWVNGTIGHVYKLKENELQVVLEDGDIHTIEPETWGNMEYSYDEKEKSVIETVKGSFRQYPVKLAWALTIHKSQGLTFNHIIIDFGRGAFTGGQSYVALSRCTSLEGITLASPLRPNDIYVSRAVQQFALSFNDPKKITGALEWARADSLYAEAGAAFDKRKFSEALERFAEAAAIRSELSDRRIRRLLAIKLYGLDDSRCQLIQLRHELEKQQRKLDVLAEEFADMGLQCLDEAWDAAPAMANFDKALDLNPRCYRAITGKARALIQTGDNEAAIDLLSKASREYKRYEAPYELGSLYLSTGDLDNAAHYLKKAHRLAPRRPDILDALADTCDALDNPEQASRYRARAAELRKKQNR